MAWACWHWPIGYTYNCTCCLLIRRTFTLRNFLVRILILIPISIIVIKMEQKFSPQIIPLQFARLHQRFVNASLHSWVFPTFDQGNNYHEDRFLLSQHYCANGGCTNVKLIGTYPAQESCVVHYPEAFFVNFIYLEKYYKPVLPWLFLIFIDKWNGAKVILQKCPWTPTVYIGYMGTMLPMVTDV